MVIKLTCTCSKPCGNVRHDATVAVALAFAEPESAVDPSENMEFVPAGFLALGVKILGLDGDVRRGTNLHRSGLLARFER